MEAKDVRNLPWKKVEDWSELSASHFNWRRNSFVCETDVDMFVENLYRDIARQLNIPYEKLQPILVAENEPFNSLKARFFEKWEGAIKTCPALIELEKTLRIPDVSKIKNCDATDKVSTCWKMFEELSDTEKMLFLEKIGRINVKIEHYVAQAEDTTTD